MINISIKEKNSIHNKFKSLDRPKENKLDEV
jgi:hypothetical protein